MPERINFILLDASYGIAGREPVVVLWGLTESGERVVLLDRRFRPYFYGLIAKGFEDQSQRIVESIKRLSRGRSPIIDVSILTKKHFGRPRKVVRVTTVIPESVREYREEVKAHFPKQKQRKIFWENALKGTFAELVYAGQDASARLLLDDLLAKGQEENPVGEVYLVGAGPGDPDLLTFKAVRLMQQADVMVYDRLVSKPILDMANRNAERLYVGKEKDNHAVPQDKINDLLVDLAKQGKRVLRLKGGDPFIFGRGGEEIETLAENSIPFQVVPAITAASGCSSYAGIPLTHRDYAQSVTFATGHLKDGSINLNWQQLTQKNHTIVFYMGLTGISVISEQLQAHGLSGDTPAALVEQGTTRNQRVHIGTVATLPQLVIDSNVRAPTLTIIGEVVQLHDKLHWYKPEQYVQETEFSRNKLKPRLKKS